MTGEVISLKQFEWQVFWNGRLLKPTFNSKGAALAYLAGLQKGRAPV